MAYVRHGVLEADTVTTLELPARAFSNVEVSNIDGVAAIYFLVLNPRHAADDPEVEGDDCEVLPAAMSALTVDAPSSPVTVKLISAGTPEYSVRAE